MKRLRPWLTPAEAGQIVGMSSWSITRMCVDGEISVLPHKKGAAWKIITAHLLSQFGLTEANAFDRLTSSSVAS